MCGVFVGCMGHCAWENISVIPRLASGASHISSTKEPPR